MSEKETGGIEKATLKDQKQPKPAAKKEAKKETRKVNRIAEMKSEIKKIRWPSIKQVINNTLVVVATVLIIGGIIWIFDFLLGLANSGLRGLL